MKKGILRFLGLLLVAAGALMATGCQGTSKWFITGSIDGTTYEKNGYVVGEISGGVTFLLAADSAVGLAAFDGIWQINFMGTTAGTYVVPDVIVAYYQNAGTTYGSGGDIVVEVSEYSSDEVIGTFSGSFTYSGDGLEYPVTGAFRVPL